VGALLTKIEFKPGIVTDDSDLQSEGAWADADKVRFIRGRPQTVGGWEYYDTAATYANPVRGAHAWAMLTGEKVYAYGTSNKLYAYINEAQRDITPPHSEGVLLNPFTTVSGSTAVTVAHVAHRFRVGMSVTFTHATATGGITISGAYTVTTVAGTDSYTITAAGAASSSVTGGGYVDYTAVLPDGLVDAGPGPRLRYFHVRNRHMGHIPLRPTSCPASTSSATSVRS
jgi:hypothetical protein